MLCATSFYNFESSIPNGFSQPRLHKYSLATPHSSVPLQWLPILVLAVALGTARMPPSRLGSRTCTLKNLTWTAITFFFSSSVRTILTPPEPPSLIIPRSQPPYCVGHRLPLDLVQASPPRGGGGGGNSGNDNGAEEFSVYRPPPRTHADVRRRLSAAIKEVGGYQVLIPVRRGTYVLSTYIYIFELNTGAIHGVFLIEKQDSRYNYPEWLCW